MIAHLSYVRCDRWWPEGEPSEHACAEFGPRLAPDGWSALVRVAFDPARAAALFPWVPVDQPKEDQ